MDGDVRVDVDVTVEVDVDMNNDNTINIIKDGGGRLDGGGVGWSR